MFPISIWSDAMHKVSFEIFQRENQIICKELNPLLSEGDVAEHILIDRSTCTPFIIDEALDTPEKQKRAFAVLTEFEINKDGKASILPYDPCHAWLLTATQIAILYQAKEAETSDHLIWQVVDHGERGKLSRIPADRVLTHDIQACPTPEKRTTYLKDRRVTLVHDDRGNLKSIVAEQIKSKLDNSKVITSENWAVTVVVTADLQAEGSGTAASMRRSGHCSIVIEGVQNLTHKLYFADLRAEDLKSNGGGRAVVRLNEFDVRLFDVARYQGQSETMIVAKVLVEKMMKRIKWEIAQQEQGTPKVNYHVLGSGVNRAFYKIIDIFDSMEIYQATQMIDPPATAINGSPLERSAAEEAWEALGDVTDETSTIGVISALVAPIIAGLKDTFRTWRRAREIERKALEVQRQAFKVAIDSQRQPDQEERMEALEEEKGIIGAFKARMAEAKEAGEAARKVYERSCRAIIPNLIRVEEDWSFRPERGGLKKYVEIKTLPDNCDTWAMHKVSLIGKRLHLDVLSELWSIPSHQIGKFVLEDIPLPPESTEVPPIDTQHFLQLIRRTNDPVRIREAELFVASMSTPSLSV